MVFYGISEVVNYEELVQEYNIDLMPLVLKFCCVSGPCFAVATALLGRLKRFGYPRLFVCLFFSF